MAQKFTSERGKVLLQAKVELEGKRGFSGNQKVEEIKQKFLQESKLFEDPEFSADEESIGVEDLKSHKVVWKRPKVRK